MPKEPLKSSVELANAAPMRIPNESAEYRTARTALLAEEIELRRHIERVAEQRRALPPGGEVLGDYQFSGEDGRMDFVGLFGDKPTLVVYSAMFGPGMPEPCPMCTNVVGPWDANALDLDQQVSFVVVARSPLERLMEWKRQRSWRNIRIYSDVNDNYSRDYFAVSTQGQDIPALNVFARRDGTIRHFWSCEMTMNTADPGQDPRGAPELGPMWTILDATPDGRDPQWYPKLTYGSAAHTCGSHK